MTLIDIWASPELDDAGPYLGITGTWILSYIPGTHLALVTMVPPGPHLDEVTGSHRDITWTWCSGSHLGIMGPFFSVPEWGLT